MVEAGIEASPARARPSKGGASISGGVLPAGSRDIPVTRRERLVTLDVLRGFALLGILAVNIETFAGPEGLHDIPMGVVKPAFVGWHAHLDLLILAIKWLFIEGKMRALFAMLFGAGAVLLTDRIEQRAGPAHARLIFLRRNALLVLFGLLHATFIWAGDILFVYGACGLLVPLLLRRLEGRKLVALGLALCLISIVVGLPRFLDMRYGSPDDRQGAVTLSIARFTQPQSAAQLAAFKARDQADSQKMARDAATEVTETRSVGYFASRLPQAEGFLSVLAGQVVSGFILEVLGPIVMGMGLYKLGFFSGLLSTRIYALTAITSYAISVPIVLVGIWMSCMYDFSMQATLFWMDLPYGVEQIAGALANASVILLCVRKGWFRSLFVPLGAVGQTALSNYIFTSLICQFIFLWGPWQLYGTLEYYQGLYVIAAIWALNLALSPIWLRHFAFGPLEWVWRSLTYGRRQPLRLAR